MRLVARTVIDNKNANKEAIESSREFNAMTRHSHLTPFFPFTPFLSVMMIAAMLFSAVGPIACKAKSQPTATADTTPEAAFEQFLKYQDDNDYGQLWDALDSQSQKRINARMERTKKEMNKPALSGKTGRDLFIALYGIGIYPMDPFADIASVESTTIDGNMATIEYTTKAGEAQVQRLIIEVGTWKVRL